MSAKITRSSFGSQMAVMATLVALLTTTPSFGDSDLSAESDASAEAETSVEDSTGSSGSGAAQETGSDRVSAALAKLQVHGFLTQAWANAEFVEGGPTANEASIGIPDSPTTNYRFLALQFRYDMSPKDVFVVQLSSRTLGTSPVQTLEDDIELDWAFYERRLTDNTRLKIGRVQIPFGIYNEVRDVGTVLPFYRPPFNFYKEGAFTNETVDGASLSHTFFSDKDWGLEASVYAGEWTSIFVPANDVTTAQIDTVSNGYGYQLWLNTPLSGLRIGTGLMSAKQEGSVPLRDPRRDIWTAAIDGTFGRFTFQAEWQTNDFEVLAPIGIISTRFTNWYVQAGVKATEKFRIWGLLDVSDLLADCLCYTDPADRTFREDTGVSFLYYFTPNILLRAEHHWTEENGVTFRPVAPGLLRPTLITMDGGNYTIVSVSVSF